MAVEFANEAYSLDKKGREVVRYFDETTKQTVLMNDEVYNHKSE